jgi:hypothetical protein
MQTGRFWQIDPLAEKYDYNSTYAFSENKVTSHVELEGLEAESYIYRYWRNSDGQRNANETYSTTANQFGYGNTGVYISYDDEINNIHGSYFQPEMVITASRPDNRDLNTRIGDWAGNLVVNSQLGKAVESFDYKIRKASEVGLNLNFGIKLNGLSASGSLGLYSTDENNFGFTSQFALAGENNFKYGFLKGFATNLTEINKSLSFKLGAYMNDGDVKTGFGITNKTDAYTVTNFGPVYRETNGKKTTIGLSLLKKDWNTPDISVGGGVRNKTEFSYRSPIFSTKPTFVQ